MGSLSKEQLEAIREYLAGQGMTYKPLQDEMLDHISCDMEKLIESGHSFDQAWRQITKELPPKQVQTIQLETMETVNKKESLSKWFAYLSFFLLFAGSVFKLMKFPGAGQLLIGSFIAIALALVSGSAFGMLTNRKKRGGWLLMLMLAGALFFLSSFIFQILHLPGATEQRVLSVGLLLVTYVTSFFYLRGEGNYLLPWLHCRYSPAINRFVIILFLAALIMRMPSLLFRYADMVPLVTLVITIAAAGLHFHALCWQRLSNGDRPSIGYSIVLSVSFACFILPALTEFLLLPWRGALASGFWLLGGIIAAATSSQGWQKAGGLAVAVFVSLLSVLWTLMIGGVLTPAFAPVVFNGVVLAALLTFLIVFRSNALFRTYLVAAIAHYLYFYSPELGLW